MLIDKDIKYKFQDANLRECDLPQSTTKEYRKACVCGGGSAQLVFQPRHSLVHTCDIFAKSD